MFLGKGQSAPQKVYGVRVSGVPADFNLSEEFLKEFPGLGVVNFSIN